MKTVRACLALVALFSIVVVGSAEAVIIADSSINGTVTNTFEGIGTGNVDTLLSQTGAKYGERFSGQVLGTSGDFDTLSGAPSNPLTLLVGAPAQNLHLLSYISSVVLAGCSAVSGGCPASNAIGEGAVSVLLTQDTDVFGFDVVGSNAGTGDVRFFDRAGASLGTFTVALADSFFGFRVTSGNLIAGVSLTNFNGGGIGFDNFEFNQAAAVPLPATLGLVALGLAVVVGRRRRTEV